VTTKIVTVKKMLIHSSKLLSVLFWWRVPGTYTSDTD
jgi:hypothetical protein